MLVKSLNRPKQYCEGGYWEYADSVTTTTECIVQDYDGFSGLYNSDGAPLYKPKQKIGFI